MISLKVTRAQFFDRQLLAAIDRRRLDGMAQAGAYLRTAIQRSMRRRARPSAVGEPPSARTDRTFRGRKVGGALRNLMSFGYDSRKGVVIVGPEPLSRGGPMGFPNWSPYLSLLEFGGLMRNTLHRDLRIGMGAAVVVHRSPRGRGLKNRNRSAKAWKADPTRWRTTKEVRVGPRPSDKALVTFAKLRTPTQLARAKDIQTALWGPRFVNLGGRSYLRSNLLKHQDTLARIIEDSVLGRRRGAIRRSA